jgi:hypothetical protein
MSETMAILIGFFADFSKSESRELSFNASGVSSSAQAPIKQVTAIRHNNLINFILTNFREKRKYDQIMLLQKVIDLSAVEEVMDEK